VSELDVTCPGLQIATELQPDTVRHLRTLIVNFLATSNGVIRPDDLLKVTPKLSKFRFSFSSAERQARKKQLPELVNSAQQRMPL
jgi:hypothetical protein